MSFGLSEPEMLWWYHLLFFGASAKPWLCQEHARALPGVPAAEMQFIPLSPKAEGSVDHSSLGSVSIHCIYFFGETEPKTVLVKYCKVH